MLTLGMLKERMSRLDNWSLEDKMLVKEIMFKDFKEAIEFVNKVADISNKMNHFPSIMVDFNVVRLRLITHEVNELTEKDFDVAEEIDKIEIYA